MRITIEMTNMRANCGDGEGSVWRGKTAGGCPVEALLIALAPRPQSVAELASFDEEFAQQPRDGRIAPPPQLLEMVAEIIDPEELLRIAMRLLVDTGQVTPAVVRSAVEDIREHIQERWDLSAAKVGPKQ